MLNQPLAAERRRHAEYRQPSVGVATIASRIQSVTNTTNAIQYGPPSESGCQPKLLERLHNLVDAASWLRRQETRGAVLSEIRIRLNDFPEQPYPQGLWEAKVEQVSDFLLRRFA